jgi:hypothetical protein
MAASVLLASERVLPSLREIGVEVEGEVVVVVLDVGVQTACVSCDHVVV